MSSLNSPTKKTKDSLRSELMRLLDPQYEYEENLKPDADQILKLIEERLPEELKVNPADSEQWAAHDDGWNNCLSTIREKLK